MKRDLTPAQLAQEVTVTLPLSVLLGIGEPAAAALAQPQPVVPASSLPAIGAPWNDGIYAGITVHENQPMALVLLSGDEKKSWPNAVAWAELNGGALPSRIDQLVLFKNLKAEFKEAWYWSGEQYAGNDACAWYQNFGNGYQYYDHKGHEYRCRAVRRVPIQ